MYSMAADSSKQQQQANRSWVKAHHTGWSGGALELLPKTARPGFWRGTNPGLVLLSVLASASTYRQNAFSSWKQPDSPGM